MQMSRTPSVLLPQAHGRLRGFGLLQVLLLIAVLAGLAVMGYLQWRERSAVDSSRQEQRSLAQADRAIATFATVMRRLPCPDTDRDGLEDCADTAQKGWLPSITLSLAGADSGVDVGQLRYLVQRGGGGNDLTVLDDAWRPLEYDTTGKAFHMRATTAMTDGTYKAGILTLPDLCQRLDVGRTATYATGMAEVRSVPARTVAYALVHPGAGDADGDGSLFDGVNASPDSAVEDPSRQPLLAQYNDIVLERSFPSLQVALHCAPLIDSINTVALGHDVALQVDDLRKDNIEAAKQAIIFAALGAALTAADTTVTVLGGISDAGNAAVDWAICAASLGLAVNACAAGTFHTSAAVAAGAMMYLNFASVAANVTAAVMAGNALALADSSVDASTLTCPVNDMSQAIAAAAKGVTDAKTDRDALKTQITNKQNELANANSARNTAIDTLWAKVRGGKSSTAIDGRIATVLNAANNWETNWSAVQASLALIGNDVTGQSDYGGYKGELKSWTEQANTYAYMLAHRTDMVTQLQSEIAALDVQIAAETDPTAKAALQKERLEKTSQLTLLNDPVKLQEQYDDAVTKRDQAQANLTAEQQTLTQAQANLSTAQTDYQSAFGNLRNAGRYALYDGDGHVVGTACTGGCRTGDVFTGSGIRDALLDLFGSSTAPRLDSKYLKPVELQKALKALQDQLPNAEKRVTDAQDLYDQLVNRPDPPPCNITGKGVTPMPPQVAEDILIQVDEKGGTR